MSYTNQCVRHGRLNLSTLLAVILLVIGGKAMATVEFKLTDAVQLSLHQTAQVEFSKGSSDGNDDMKFSSTDMFYFVREENAKNCNSKPIPDDIFNVSTVDHDGGNAKGAFTVRSSIFTVGDKYGICYVSGNKTFPAKRVDSGGDGSQLDVCPSLYRDFSLSAEPSPHGLDLLRLTVEETAQKGRPVNSGFGGNRTIFLFPCGNVEECSDASHVSELCAKASEDTIELNELEGVGTGRVTGTFSLQPSSTKKTFAICVSYCGAGAEACSNPSHQERSYTAVEDGKKDNTGAIITFEATNTNTYSTIPVRPQAREEGYLQLHGGSTPTEGDKIIIVQKDSACSDKAPLLYGLQVGKISVENAMARVNFSTKMLIDDKMEGNVCYYNHSSNEWSKLRRIGDGDESQESYFTIEVLQPTSFAVVSPAVVIGQRVEIELNGTGLDATRDSAFVSLDTCGDHEKDGVTRFNCSLRNGHTPKCRVVVDPDSNGGGMLRVCYRKSGSLNAAEVNGRITINDRNPSFELAPYPLRGGQTGSMTFHGHDLSAADTVYFVSVDTECTHGMQSNKFRAENGFEVEKGTVYRYDVVGEAHHCLKVCYYIRSLGVWSVARPQGTMEPTNGNCGKNHLYVSEYDLRFELPDGKLTLKETATVALSSGIMPSDLKLVRSWERCVFHFCLINNRYTSACELPQNEDDYVSARFENSVSIFGASTNVEYILCAKNGAETYIPVLHKGRELSAANVVFEAEDQVVKHSGHSPDVWRVGEVSLNSTFRGRGLNAGEDTVLVFKDDAMLGTKTKVCPPLSNKPNTVLNSTALSGNDSTSSVAFRYRGSHALYTGAVVHLCYVWGGGKHVTYTESIQFSESQPSSISDTPAGDDAKRAGLRVTLKFHSNTSVLRLGSESVHFYRFVNSSGPRTKCYCDDDCPENDRVTYQDVALVAGEDDNTTVWENPSGFDNHGYGAIYVVCYASSLRNSTTYMGNVIVGMAQPTFYEATSQGGVHRSYRPITIGVTQECMKESCIKLTDEHRVRLIPERWRCHDLVGDVESGAEGIVGDVVVTDRHYKANVVVNDPGRYRVCYGIESVFTELPQSSKYETSPLTVKGPEPSDFTTIPDAPSAGQFLAMKLECDQSVCSACIPIRLLPGKNSSCWDDKTKGITSTNCEGSVTTITFPYTYLEKGDYRVCYGDDVSQSHMVPKWLNVGPANPAFFTPSHYSFYANQDTPIVLEVKGSDLSQEDEIFILPGKGISCHDLRNDSARPARKLSRLLNGEDGAAGALTDTDGVLAKWSFVAHEYFESGLIHNNTLCDQPGTSCSLQLCYKRSGTTWAPVRSLSGKNMTLLPPNPSVVSFDNNSVSVGMYGTSTVNGTELTEKDEMAVRRGNCSGETVMVGVGTPIVNDDGTQWARVVRFNGTSADGYVACYTKGGNVMRVDIDDNNRGNFTIRENELHYELRGSGVSPEHQLAQYELLGVSIGPPDEGMQAIEAIDLIDESQECNYAPFYEAHEKDPEFKVTIKLEPNTSGLFFGRLRVAPSTYALCVNTTSSLFLVRTTSAGKTLSVFNATPSEYSLKPVIPFVGQSINFTFFSTANLRLSTEDSVRIINGTLYECGLKNVTSIGEYNVTTAEVREGQVAVATDVRFTSEYVGQRLTVCYRRNGGSYATVGADDKLDLNIAPIEPIPSKWTSVPLQPQAGRTLVVTFHGNESKEDILSPEDEPKLILKTGSTFEPSCDDSGNVVGGNVTMDGMNSVWTIPAEKVREGSYVVCYTSKAFGATLRVKPDILEVYETQSPKSVSVGEDGSLTVFIGERFYMKFETDVSLTPELVYERQSTPAANDEVLLSKTRDCKNPLTASNVAAIPKDFGFVEKKDDPKGAYLHLVMGGETEMPGEFYICMRRSNRESDQAFFDFETIGDLFSPAFIKVTEAPISNFTIRPPAPRAWVPQNTLSFTFGGRYNNTNFSSIFFVTKSESNRVDSDLINNCFRPTKNEAIPDGNIQLLEEGLQVDTSTGVMRAPFENGGSYHLCFRVGTDEKSYAAPVYRLPIAVKDPSPRNFTTAEILLVNMPFQITFEATDPIFSEKELMQNDVRLVTVQNDDVTESGRPSCVNRTQIEDIKVANGKSWTRETDERANWTTTVKTKSHLLVCFRVSGQDEYFSVPNSRGGHIFSVGLSGARRYFVDPSTPYMGQQVNITVLGSRLGSSDRIKVVEVTKEESENASDSVCYGKPYEAESENDGGSPNHNGGHSVNVVSPSQTWYQLRVNKSGRFIVCYKNTAVSSEWDRLPDLPYFDVGEPHPSGYELRSSSLYVTEQTLLNITDTEGKLAHGDKIKLVERTEASKRFVCTEEASGSKAIEVLEPIGSHSNANAAAYRVCAKEAVTVAVCYALKNGTWAEVPAQSSPNSYVFKNITFSASPFSGFIFEPESPRPFELFQLSFNSSVVDVSADFVKFAQGPQRSCDPDPPFVAPAFYHKNSTPNRFSVAMAKQGSYQLYIGTNESKMERGIAHQDRITIAPCNPCGFAPSFGFIGSNITLKFKGASNGKVSGGKSGLSLNDTIILANVTSEGDGRYPCDSPEGPLASKEWKATSVDHTSGTATFLIPLEKDERYVGDYYICYKRADTHLGYSLVPVGNTLNESTFSVYPDFISTMEMCPSQPLFLETMTFTLSYKEAIYSKILFTKEDEFSLRPQGMDCSGSTTPEAEDVIRPTLNSSVVGKAQWEVSLPSGHSHRQYTLCIKPRHFDRNVDVTPKVLSVKAQEPSYVVSEPPLSPSQQGPFKMFVYGRSLTSDDTAYLVAATEPCNEKCGETLAPTQLPGAEMKQRYMNESLVELTVKKIPTEDVALCYRRKGRGLVRSAYFLMHNTVPFDYVWDFVPRVGTRPKLTFRGNQLSEGDRMAIVKHGRNCDPNLADAVGIFYSLGADSSWATFYLPLTNAGAGLYTVCYRRKHLQDYVQMRQPLEVFPGGPSRYQTSNNPMLGRATEVTFPNDTHQPSTGDEAMITCPNCNCFDGESAALPYGQSYGIVSEAGGNIKLRVGMEAAGEYPVCYRVSGSGFAQVGAKPITPVPRWPNDAKVSPSPTYQGQRAKVKVLGTTGDELTVGKPFEDVRTTGSVMIVSAERKCWETYEANGTGVFSHCENVNLTDSGKDECSLHVPSLGPNVPPQETVFPLDYTVCYREANQSEFVAIVPEEGNLAIQKADPSSMETHPKLVSSGMKNISMKFPNAAPGDTASIVKFEGPTLNISTPCDNTTNEVAVAESAYPTYLFGLPSALEEKLLVVCYTKAEGTVAEVPQLLELQEPNPSGWETIPPNDTVRFRQYFNISFGGVGLDPAEDSVVFSDEPCDSVSSLNSTSQKFYQRVGQFAVAENVEDESRLTTVAQLVAHEDVTRVYVCYRRGMSWINVGSPLSLKDPVPQRVNFTPPIGKARVGHHIYIKQEDGKTIDGIKFDVISASEPSPQSWCHNYTAESVLEPHLQKVNESFVEVPVWRTGGPVRLCVRTSGGESSDVSLTPTGNISELHILGPNPASFQSEPAPPRVGQQVTLRFKLVDEPGEEDLVRIAVPNATVGCDSAQAIVGLNDTLRVTKSGENESVVTLISTNDTWNYSSFVTPGRYSVCYYSANEGQWSLIGGSSTTGEIEVRQMAPNSWKLQSDEAPHTGESFILQFNDLEGALDATGDLAWAVPKNMSCGDPLGKNCLDCINFKLDRDASTSNTTYTTPSVSFVGGEYNVCYQLRNVTPILLPESLTIKSNGVKCIMESNVTAGEFQKLTFFLEDGATVGNETWRVSTYDPNVLDCSHNFEPDFVEGRSGYPVKNETTMSYDVEWPVSMTKEKYRICFNNSGVGQLVCPCTRFLPWGGDCYLSVLKPKVAAKINPKPVYVGQTVKLNFSLTDGTTDETLSNVKFVKYHDGLTVCNNASGDTHRLFDEKSMKGNLTDNNMEIELDHSLGPMEVIICANLSSSSHFTRVSLEDEPASSQTLNVRPYLKLGTSPEEEHMIRAGRTLQLTFGHASREEDDVVGDDDEITFVRTPEECREAKISGNVINNFYSGECSFSALPAKVRQPNNDTKTSSIVATFENKAETGLWYVCYKLQSGTWAPVFPPINLSASAVQGCSYSFNGEAREKKESRRVLQYVKTTIRPQAGAEGIFNEGDKLRVVPKKTPCFESDGTIFEARVTMQSGAVAALTHVQNPGDYKFCYQYGDTGSEAVSWSPVCEAFDATPRSPTVKHDGCLRLGQTLTFNLMHSEKYTFNREEVLRFVSGNDECIDVNGKETYSTTVKISGAEQTINGTAIASENTSFTTPPVYLGNGTQSLRLCYKDKDGNHFLVPFDMNGTDLLDVGVSGSIISSVSKQGSLVVGERPLVSFIATTGSVDHGPGLKPYGPSVPFPYEYGPEYNGNFDVATALVLENPASDYGGYCFMRKASGSGVYGNATKTVGAIEPKNKGIYLFCYRSVGCSVEDVGASFRVYGPNPTNWTSNLTPIRRGQLFDLDFDPNSEEDDSTLLSEGDLYAIQKEGISCWNLLENEGAAVIGKGNRTKAHNIIIHSEAPSNDDKPSEKFVVCYRLKEHTWTEVANRPLVVEPANPSSFNVKGGAARALQVNTIEFRGTNLGKSDRVKIVRSSDLCSNTSEPPNGITPHPRGNDNSVSGASSGWPVASATSDTALIVISSETAGVYTVCYRLADDAAWTQVYGNLTILPRIPVTVSQTPEEAAEGQLFTLNFTVGDELPSEGDGLTGHDQVKLYVGNVSCAQPGRDPDVIATSPSRTDHLPYNLTFQMASGTRGEQTLCYVRNGSVVWGFEPITIRPNPWNLITHPMAPTPTRANHLVSMVFTGFGLASGPEGKADEVRLVSARNPRGDESCYQEESGNSVHYYPLEANGTHFVQTIRITPQWMGSYWVCYKLNGGKFRMMLDSELKVIEPDPFHAMSAKGSTVMDGELTTWAIMSTSPPPETALVFYSSERCNDFRYYEDPGNALGEFPHDVAYVKGSSASLRARKSTGEDESLSLCYLEGGVTSLLVEKAMRVIQGTPPILKEPVQAIARNIFNFTLDVDPTDADYVVLVDNPAACVGLDPPASSSDLFTYLEPASGKVRVTTAVEREGTYHICYSHPTGDCQVGGSRECARVVGTVIATAADPSGWSADPTTVYTTDLLQIKLSRQHINALLGFRSVSPPIAEETLWLVPLEDKETTNMKDVALACMSTVHGGGTPMQPSVHQKDLWTVRVMNEGSYGLCFLPMGMELPAIFPPRSSPGPVVLPSVVENVTVLTTPSLGINSLFNLEGKGLTTDDEVVAVGTSGVTPPNDVCTNTTYKPRVNGSFAMKRGQGLHSLLVEFQFPVLGRYVICFRSNISTGDMKLITAESFAVENSLLTFNALTVPLVNVPLVLEFRGVGLVEEDEAALVADTGKKNGDPCNTGKFKRVDNVSGDGATAFYNSTPHEAGNHVVCFRKQDSYILQLPTPISVADRTATKAEFRTQPVCKASKKCSQQPLVALVNSSGGAASDPTATVYMRLKNEEGKYVDDLLSGGNAYSDKDHSTFQFLELAVSEPGTYVMEANFNLSGGVTIRGSSSSFKVDSDPNPVDPATLSCIPKDIIPRATLPDGTSDMNVNVSCKITAGPNGSPTSYIVTVTGGSHTEVTPDKPSGGPPTYSFTAFPPHDDPKTELIYITVTANVPAGSVPVKNSPVRMFIGSKPEPESTLQCKSSTVGLPQPWMVRQKDQLKCSAQGKRKINGTEENVAALPKYFHFVKQYNNDSVTNNPIAIGSHPDNEEGAYLFNVSVDNISQSISVLGSISNDDTSGVQTPMKGSPASFAVIGDPRKGESGVTCVSKRTSSEHWYSPSEQLRCTLTLVADGKPVLGVPHDFVVNTPGGGDVKPDDVNALGSTLYYSGTAPPAPTADMKMTEEPDYLLSFTFLYKPSDTPVASTSATLVFVRAVTVHNESNSTFTSLTLAGSGLSTGHRYGARRTSDCSQGVEATSIVKPAENESGSLHMQVNYGGGLFYLCFAPSDRTESWGTLVNGVVDNSAPGDAQLDTWFFLLIGGVILLFVLLVLLVVLVWHLCKGMRRDSKMLKDFVYMRPRPNDRFTSAAPGTPAASQALNASGKVRSLSLRKNSGGRRNGNHSRTDDGVNESANTNYSVVEQVKADPAPIVMPNTKQVKEVAAKNPSGDGSKTGSTETYEMKIIPTVPPPKPPPSEASASDASLRREQSTTDRQGSTSVGSASTAQPKDDQRGLPPIQPRPPQLGSAQQPKPLPSIIPTTDATTTDTIGDSTNGNHSWVGPFRIMGYTSRPVINQAQQNDDLRKGPPPTPQSKANDTTAGNKS